MSVWYYIQPLQFQIGQKCESSDKFGRSLDLDYGLVLSPGLSVGCWVIMIGMELRLLEICTWG